MSNSTKEKKPINIGEMLRIQNALFLIEELTPAAIDGRFQVTQQYLEDMAPLVAALKNNEYDLIAASIPNRPMSDKARMKLQTMIFVYNMISEPHKVLGFEIELAKKDVLDIMENVFVTLNKSIPTKTRTLTNWWKPIDLGLKSIGLRVEQSRMWNPDPNLIKWIETRKKLIDSGKITFARNGEPMENGKPMFFDFPNDLGAYW
jgi:hypothetical protein